MSPVLRIAHRGMPTLAPENTLPSFRLALDAGADGIELDVHATADGTVVVHHDDQVPGGAMIHALAWDEVRRVEVAPGVGVPTLREVVELVADQAVLFVELKGSGIERLVAAELARVPRDSVAVHSFDAEMIARLGVHAPALRTGVLIDQDVVSVRDLLARTRAMDLWPEHALVDEQLIHVTRALGARVIPWTVNDSARARELAALGVEGICTDDVRLLDAAG